MIRFYPFTSLSFMTARTFAFIEKECVEDMGLESGQVIKNIIKDAVTNNEALLHKKKTLP